MENQHENNDIINQELAILSRQDNNYNWDFIQEYIKFQTNIEGKKAIDKQMTSNGWLITLINISLT